MPAVYPTEHVVASFPSENVLLLTMQRAKINALNTALWVEIGKHMDVASADSDVRCVVLASGLDKIYTAGLDLTESGLDHDGTDAGRLALQHRSYIKLLQDAVSAIERCDKPVIAAVHGVCLGGGIDIIVSADIRYAAEGSTFSIKEVDVGLAADVGSLQRLPKTTASASLLNELALTARNFGPQEAYQLGLVSKVVPGGKEGVLKAALDTAKVIASKSPIATLGTKHLLTYSRDHTTQEGERGHSVEGSKAVDLEWLILLI
ncbi:BZ3500_MvSof-1268-A1-R1_Chr9g10858 [Microbotryum saponariae]|uniref:BZ3500_MvSof-1268-A1-R1_Chr9g10858 protein n=1 Tax=Microbotryum saponariae TaxID=289078 RepID=A0A2X0N6G3_9BASI|nr:BZ3501_MvSof-1269-A2-R1_Chr9g10606 [Microbotryum saponariae]SDA00816.1 BZ3500_MvSof-1268-A1-R1_Chr9g10858 [Microbotryum saponariae]